MLDCISKLIGKRTYSFKYIFIEIAVRFIPASLSNVIWSFSGIGLCNVSVKNKQPAISWNKYDNLLQFHMASVYGYTG